MAAASEGSPPQRPPTPRSPPRYPDLCGRRRLQLEVQILNREIGFVEEELKSLEGLQSISRCCKEVSEFVGTNPDPLIPLNKRGHKTCHIWKWLRKMLCLCLPCICCGNPCLLQLKRSSCTCLHLKNCCHCKFGCPRCNCCALSCWKPCYLNCTSCWPHSCRKASCCRPQCTKCGKPCSCCNASHCIPSKLSCPEFSCGCVWSCPECTVVRLCPKCCKPCCGGGYLC